MPQDTTEVKLKDGRTIVLKGSNLSPQEVAAGVSKFRASQPKAPMTDRPAQPQGTPQAKDAASPLAAGDTREAAANRAALMQPGNDSASVTGDTLPETGALGQYQANLPQGPGATLGAAFSGVGHFIKDILGGDPQQAFTNYIADPMKAEANVGRQLQQRGDALSRFAGLEHRVASYIPVFGSLAGQAMEQIAKGDMSGGAMSTALLLGSEEGGRRAPGAVEAAGDVGKGVAEAGGMGKASVQSASQMVLNQEMGIKKIQLGNVVKATGDEIGKHVDALHEGDHTDLLNTNRSGAISATRTLDTLGNDLDLYRPGTQNALSTPVGQVVGMLSQRGPVLTFSQAKDIRTSVGNLAYQVAKDSRDAAILKGVYGDLTDQMAGRSADLGLSDSWNQYNKVHSVMSDHTHNFLGSLLDAKNGQDFFNALKDRRNAQTLGQFTKDAGKYGLDPNWMDSSNVDKILKYANRGDTGGGRMAAITKNPVAGGAGFVLGGQLAAGVGTSGFLGSLIGASFMSDMSQRVSALRQIGQLGVPEFSDKMPGPTDPAGKAAQLVSTPEPPTGGTTAAPAPATPQAPAAPTAAVPVSQQIQQGIAKMVKMAAGGSSFGDLEDLLNQHKQDTEKFLSDTAGGNPANVGGNGQLTQEQFDQQNPVPKKPGGDQNE